MEQKKSYQIMIEEASTTSTIYTISSQCDWYNKHSQT